MDPEVAKSVAPLAIYILIFAGLLLWLRAAVKRNQQLAADAERQAEIVERIATALETRQSPGAPHAD